MKNQQEWTWLFFLVPPTPPDKKLLRADSAGIYKNETAVSTSRREARPFYSLGCFVTYVWDHLLSWLWVWFRWQVPNRLFLAWQHPTCLFCFVSFHSCIWETLSPLCYNFSRLIPTDFIQKHDMRNDRSFVVLFGTKQPKCTDSIVSTNTRSVPSPFASCFCDGCVGLTTTGDNQAVTLRIGRTLVT